MKLTFRQIEPFVKSPDPAARVVLVFGPDEGLMKERAALIGKTVVADLNDPFNVAVLSADSLGSDPARLNDEARAISMMGGNRLIRIESGADSLTPLIKDYLADPSPTALVVIEGGDLSTRSSLRKLVESAKNAAALPCYVAEARDVSGLIREMLQESGLRIDNDASAWLSQQLTGDRLLARAEIEKLITYMISAPDKSVHLDDVIACCGQGGAKSLDDLIFATLGGDTESALRTFRQLLDEGTAIIAMLRSLQNHVRRLHLARVAMDQGANAKEAMDSLNPKIFFKWEDSFRGQLMRFSTARLDTIMQRLMRLEADCKQTGTPDELVTAQALLSISAASRR